MLHVLFRIHKNENWQCFFMPSVLLLSTLLSSRAVVSRAGSKTAKLYIQRDTLDCDGYVTKNKPMVGHGSPCLLG